MSSYKTIAVYKMVVKNDDNPKHSSLISPKNEITYEASRLLNKNSYKKRLVLFLSVTLDTGIISNQFFFGKAGLLLGTLLVPLIVFLNVYVMERTMAVATSIEKESDGQTKIETFSDISREGFGTKTEIVTKACIFSVNWTIIIFNCLNTVEFLLNSIGNEDRSETTLILIKLLVYLIFFVFILVITEPEKLSNVSGIIYLMTIMPLLIVFCRNIKDFVRGKYSSDFEYFQFSNVFPLTGSLLYCLGYMGTIFSIRSTLKNHQR
jgi:hypothetical protein